LTRRKWQPAFLITCEHGGNRVPHKYAALFAPHRDLLESHRGWDPGSRDMGAAFARALRAPLIASDVTRLLIDLNRSMRSRARFSFITRALSKEAQLEIFLDYYEPHWFEVMLAIPESRRRGRPLIHLGMHTFTPVFNGRVRRTDIGLLYDPTRRLERRFCDLWRSELREARPDLTIHSNQPYKGVSDGLPTMLRRLQAPTKYLGIELEVNQRFVGGPRFEWMKLIDTLTDACRRAAASY